MTTIRLYPSASHEPDRIDPGIWLLEASAGTGKTYTIAGLVARLLVEEGIALERIAVMTFTRPATGELRERIRSLLVAILAHADAGGPIPATIDPLIAWLGERSRSPGARERLLRALDGLDGAVICTIHAFCLRLLTTHGVALGAPPELTSSDASMHAWRSAWCQDQIRRWSADPDMRVWVERGLLPQVEDLETWAVLLERTPDCDLPELAPAREREKGSLAREFARVLAQAEDAFQRCITDKPDKGPTDRARHAAFTALRQGEGTLQQIKVLADLPGKKFAKQPELMALRSIAEDVLGLCAAFEIEFIHAYRAALAGRLSASSGELSFLDQLTGLAEGLKTPKRQALISAIGASYDAVLVDEFQDTDAQQWQILSSCFGADLHRLVLIGDPKQAIYGFRGADVETYLKARGNVPGAQQRTLGTNYRSDRSLHDAVHRLFGLHTDPFAHQAIALEEVVAAKPDRLLLPTGIPPEPVQVLIAHPQDQESLPGLMRRISDACAAEIRALLGTSTRISVSGEGGVQPELRGLRPSDVCVLVGSHDEGRIMVEALKRGGISAVALGRESIFASVEALEVRAILAAWLMPQSDAALRNAAITRLIGMPLRRLQSPDEAATELVVLSGWCAACGERWRDQGILAAWYLGLDSAGDVRSRVAGLPGGERALVNLQHVMELLAGHHADQRSDPPDLLAWLDERIAAAGSERDDPELLPRLDRDDGAVSVRTIHASKGLQFPVVVVPFAWISTKLYPLKIVTSKGRRQWRVGAGVTAEDPSYYQERIAERARLLYVALTRAEHRCVLVWSGYYGSTQPTSNLPYALGSALGWLLLGELGRTVGDLIAQWKDNPAEITAVGARRLEGLAGIGVRPLGPEAAAPVRLPLAAAPADPRSIPVLQMKAVHRQRWPSSYTGLARRMEGDAEADHDGDSLPAQMPVESGAGTAGPAVAPDQMPAGAAFGIAMHAVFEAMLGQEDPLAGFEARVPAILAGHGISAVHHAGVAERIRTLLTAPLPGCSTPLARIPRHLRRAEMPFALPVLSPSDLAAIFARHPPAAHPGYAQRLSGVRLDPGLFSGVIDLVVHDAASWHLVDWKSNLILDMPASLPGRSGRSESDDGEQALMANLREHHYPLQYHLYSVALRRLLRLRLGPGPGGRPWAIHCHYAYVRYGRYVSDVPSSDLLDALDAALGGGDG